MLFLPLLLRFSQQLKWSRQPKFNLEDVAIQLMIQYLGRGCVEVRLVLEDGEEVNAKQEKINLVICFLKERIKGGCHKISNFRSTKNFW
jgi:hypothetical protein